MGILQLPTPIPVTNGIYPQRKAMISTDNLATVTTPGYLKAQNLQTFPISAQDVIEMFYSFNPQTGTGTYGIFTVSISNSGVISLHAWQPSETASLTQNHIFLGNASNDPQDCPMTGDVGIAFSAGNAVTTVANGAITAAKVASDVYFQENFTPSVTFTTPGDLDVTYGSPRFGLSIRIFKTVKVIISIQFTPNYTTSTGTFYLTGFPQLVDGDIGGMVSSTGSTGNLAFPTDTTQLNAIAFATGNRGYITAIGTSENTVPLTETNFPSGAQQFLNVYFEYTIA